MMLRDEMRDHHQQQQQQQAVSAKITRVKRVVRRTHRQTLAGQHVARKYHRAAVRQAEYRRLKAIVPSVADKKSVSKVCDDLASVRM